MMCRSCAPLRSGHFRRLSRRDWVEVGPRRRVPEAAAFQAARDERREGDALGGAIEGEAGGAL